MFCSRLKECSYCTDCVFSGMFLGAFRNKNWGFGGNVSPFFGEMGFF